MEKTAQRRQKVPDRGQSQRQEEAAGLDPRARSGAARHASCRRVRDSASLGQLAEGPGRVALGLAQQVRWQVRRFDGPSCACNTDPPDMHACRPDLATSSYGPGRPVRKRLGQHGVGHAGDNAQDAPVRSGSGRPPAASAAPSGGGGTGQPAAARAVACARNIRVSGTCSPALGLALPCPRRTATSSPPPPATAVGGGEEVGAGNSFNAAREPPPHLPQPSGEVRREGGGREGERERLSSLLPCLSPSLRSD